MSDQFIFDDSFDDDCEDPLPVGEEPFPLIGSDADMFDSLMNRYVRHLRDDIDLEEDD